MAINDSVLNFLMKSSVKGRDRMYGLLLKMGFRSTVLSDAKYGIKLHLNPHEHIDKIIFKEGFYESEIPMNY